MKFILVDLRWFVPLNLNLLMIIIFFLGAFVVGDASMNPGDTVVARSIDLGEPVVYVSLNYRINGTTSFAWYWCVIFIVSYLAFGFLAGREAQAAGIGNAGLKDRTTLVHCHIITPC